MPCVKQVSSDTIICKESLSLNRTRNQTSEVFRFLHGYNNLKYAGSFNKGWQTSEVFPFIDKLRLEQPDHCFPFNGFLDIVF